MFSVRRWHTELTPRTRFLLRHGLIGLVVGLGLLLLGMAVWYGTRLDAFTIKSVTVEGGETIDHDAVQTVIEDQLAGTYVRLVPRRFQVWYPESDIRATLREQFTRLDTLTLTLEEQTLAVTFTEYQPSALWCTTTSRSDCVFLTSDGYAFADAPPLTGGTMLRYVTSNRDPAVTKRVAPPEVVADLQWFVKHVNERLNLYPETLLFYPNDRVTAELADEQKLLLSLRHDISDTLRYLETLLTAEEYAHLTESDSYFQYIDIRFGNKLYVNETRPTSTIAGSATTSVADTATTSDVTTQPTPSVPDDTPTTAPATTTASPTPPAATTTVSTTSSSGQEQTENSDVTYRRAFGAT